MGGKPWIAHGYTTAKGLRSMIVDGQESVIERGLKKAAESRGGTDSRDGLSEAVAMFPYHAACKRHNSPAGGICLFGEDLALAGHARHSSLGV